MTKMVEKRQREEDEGDGGEGRRTKHEKVDNASGMKLKRVIKKDQPIVSQMIEVGDEDAGIRMTKYRGQDTTSTKLGDLLGDEFIGAVVKITATPPGPKIQKTLKTMAKVVISCTKSNVLSCYVHDVVQRIPTGLENRDAIDKEVIGGWRIDDSQDRFKHLLTQVAKQEKEVQKIKLKLGVMRKTMQTSKEKFEKELETRDGTISTLQSTVAAQDSRLVVLTAGAGAGHAKTVRSTSKLAIKIGGASSAQVNIVEPPPAVLEISAAVTILVQGDNGEAIKRTLENQENLLKLIDACVRKRDGDGILTLLNKAVSASRTNDELIPDVLKDCVNFKVMNAEIFTLQILTHPFFRHGRGEVSDDKELGLDGVLPHTELATVVELTSLLVKKFSLLLECCVAGYMLYKEKKEAQCCEKESEEETEPSFAPPWSELQVEKMVEKIFAGKKEGEPIQEEVVVKVITYLLNNFTNNINKCEKPEFDVRFFNMVLEETEIPTSLCRDVFKTCKITIDDHKLSTLNAEHQHKLWVLDRGFGSEAGHFVKVGQGMQMRVCKGIIECCLLLALGFMHPGGEDASEAWEGFAWKFLKDVELKIQEWLKERAKTNIMAGYQEDTLQVIVKSGKYKWKQNKEEYKFIKDCTLVKRVREIGRIAVGKKSPRERDLQTRWVKSLYTVGQVWQFGLLGLLGARSDTCHAGGCFLTRLAFCLTGPFSIRFPECDIPRVMDSILPGLHKVGSVFKGSGFRFFDPMHYYGWGVLGWMKPIAVNVKVLCGVLKLSKEEGIKAIGTFLSDLAKKMGTPMDKVGIMLDLKELLKCDAKQLRGTTITFKQLHSVLEPFRFETAHVNDQWSPSVGCPTTTGMSKFGVSTRAKPIRTGPWRVLTKTSINKILRKATVDEKKARRTKAQALINGLDQTVAMLNTHKETIAGIW